MHAGLTLSVPQVAWSNAADPAKGFQYLFLTDSDYSRLTSKHSKPVVQARHSPCVSLCNVPFHSARSIQSEMHGFMLVTSHSDQHI